MTRCIFGSVCLQREYVPSMVFREDINKEFNKEKVMSDFITNGKNDEILSQINIHTIPKLHSLIPF